MKKIAIFSSCSYSYLSLHVAFNERHPKAHTIHSTNPIDMVGADLVIFIISACDILQYSTIFLKYCKFNPDKKIVTIGEGKHNEVFDAVIGCKNRRIDIKLPLREILNQCENIIYDNKPPLHVICENTIKPIEIEIIRMLSQGYSLTEIAIKKNRNLKTISHHKCGFFRKLGVKNRLDTLLKLNSGRKYTQINYKK
ncbi:Transcriptional activator protein BglJ [Serratia fonticola]|uniref:LuxR C-terminal-related transcriptional regulator n=1 Tax=Serratia fonticola TaxID=47917 RepID=UPI00218441E4|nr:LuxR C-terminal-related transcriptional regulator [Serratia fonticola]CAI2158587.1 Transcriptional activator protein BglJ [Serratia fonticola]